MQPLQKLAGFAAFALPDSLASDHLCRFYDSLICQKWQINSHWSENWDVRLSDPSRTPPRTLVPFCVPDISRGRPTWYSWPPRYWVEPDWATKGKNTISRLTVGQYRFCYDYGNLVERFQGATHKLQGNRGRAARLTSLQASLALPPSLPPFCLPLSTSVSLTSCHCLSVCLSLSPFYTLQVLFQRRSLP